MTRMRSCPHWKPAEIKALRKLHREPQHIFCERLGVSASALREWEQAVSVPYGPVMLLLERLQEDFYDNGPRPLPDFSRRRRTKEADSVQI
jgi:DNA-binding transcriptional regulator YiaG